MVQKLGPLILDIPSEEKFKQDHCLNLTHHYYSHALKRMYLEKYFDNLDMEKINLMVEIRHKLRKNGNYNKDILLDLYEKDKKFLKEYLEKI